MGGSWLKQRYDDEEDEDGGAYVWGDFQFFPLSLVFANTRARWNTCVRYWLISIHNLHTYARARMRAQLIEVMRTFCVDDPWVTGCVGR